MVDMMLVREQHKDLARVLDLIPDSLTIIQDGQVIFVNSTFMKVFEVNEGELGSGVDFLQVVHKDDHTEVRQRYVDRLAGKDVPSFARFRSVTLRGKVFHCEASGTVFEINNKKAVLYVVRVVDDRVEAEKALQTAHEQLEATLQALPDLLFELDYEGRIYDFRAPNPELLYLAPDQFLGKAMTEVLPPEAAKIIMEGLADVRTKGQSRGRTYALEIKGEERWFEMSAASKTDPTDERGRVVCLIRDITDRKLSERALMEKNIALNQVLEHMEQTKADYRQEIWGSMSEGILPLIRKLRSKASPECVDEVDQLEENIKLVLTGNEKSSSRGYEKLTSRESQICDYIRDGLSTKEISEKLNLSEFTVSKHREHIRDKLGLRGRAISLPTYLRLK